MMIRLLNAAVMPRPGRYVMTALTADQFRDRLLDAVQSGRVVSYIGYDATADVIQDLTGWRPPISRESTELADGDEMLVCRLKYRVANPAMKKHQSPTVGDMEFFSVIYSGDSSNMGD